MRCALIRPFVSALFAIAPALLIANEARASTGYEFPEIGTEQLGRGGAWVARASNPLATYLNPAGLAGQRSGVTLSTHLIWQKNCFSRKFPDGSTATAVGDTYKYPDEVCNEDSGTPFPNPQLAGVYRISDRLGIGLAVLGPSTRGKFKYPTTVTGSRNGQDREIPNPGRYLLAQDDLLFIWPQIGIGAEIVDDVRVGASFIWGLGHLKFTAIATGFADAQLDTASGYPTDSFDSDFRADLTATDLFVPGVTVGALVSPSDYLDIGAWYQWMDDMRAKGDTTVSGPMFDSIPRATPESGQVSTSTTGESVEIVAPWPMQARLGFRFHLPRDGAVSSDNSPVLTGAPEYRDPMSQDVFDVELDLTWADNSHFDQLTVTLPKGIVLPIGSGFEMPQDASIPHKWKDAYGARLGGDYVVIADKLAVRAGTFFQTEAQDPKYLHLDYVASQMWGLDCGATVRFGGLDLMVAYGHVFYAGLDNGGDGAVQGLAGSASQSGTDYRTEQAVNGGSNSSVVNIVSLGATYSF